MEILNIIKKNRCWQGCEERALYTAGENASWYSTVEQYGDFFSEQVAI